MTFGRHFILNQWGLVMPFGVITASDKGLLPVSMMIRPIVYGVIMHKSINDLKAGLENHCNITWDTKVLPGLTKPMLLT